MNGRIGLRRRLAATLTAIPLLVVFAFAWQLRPPLPPLPRSLRAPLPAGNVLSLLELLAWVVFVLLDLVLCWRVLAYGARREPSKAELRLRRALRPPPRLRSTQAVDWRAFAAPPSVPVMHVRASTSAEATTAAALDPSPARDAAADAAAAERAAPALAAALDPSAGRVGLRLLGPLELVGCKKKQPRRKATRELLAFLALQHGQVSRDELIEALWPGEEPRRSAERFYQAATEARQLLGDGFQRLRDNFYRLDRRRLWLDLDQFEQLRTRADDAPGDEQQALLERALALFRGEPFAGLDALWADAEARRLRAVQLELLERLGRLQLAAGAATAALAAAEQAALLDRSNERPVQLAMEAEAALGQRDAISTRYQRLCEDLDEQYGLQPSRETKQLYRRLLSQDGSTRADADETAERVTGRGVGQ